MISLAYAAAPAQQPTSMEVAMQFLPMILIFGVFYFMMLRPQMKKAKEERAMRDALQKGDEVIVQGGLMGRVVKISDTAVALEVGNNVILDFQKGAVTALLPKGTLKDLYTKKSSDDTQKSESSTVNLDK